MGCQRGAAGAALHRRKWRRFSPPPTLQIRVDRNLGVTLILDLMHVMDKLWKAASSSIAKQAWRLNSGCSTAPGESFPAR
jgi:hypothetical protein